MFPCLMPHVSINWTGADPMRQWPLIDRKLLHKKTPNHSTKAAKRCQKMAGTSAFLSQSVGLFLRSWSSEVESGDYSVRFLIIPPGI